MKKLTLSLAAVAVVALAVPAFSQDAGDESVSAAPQAAQEYRHSVMEGLGSHMKATGMIVKGEVPRRADVVAHAEAMHGASRYLCELFPDGTGPDAVEGSRSKPEIWSDRETFTEKCATFEEESGKLVEAAKGDDFDAFVEQFKATGQSCGGCHKHFREKEEEGH